ncbi:MAG: polysaccharide biosynthesis/export family protein [Granulosicoccus sp.]
MIKFAGVLLALLLSTPSLAQSVDVSGPDAQAMDIAAADLLRDRQYELDTDATNQSAPFGANLFNGGFSNDREDGLNPDYVLQPGDRVSVRIWGATAFNESLVVDPQGNIFIPTVGPVALAGVRNQDLNKRVEQSVASVYTNNVNVYTSLDGSQPVAVFVTGYVASPGRFAGIPSNSVLHFLDRAGGIDADRGSYRRIQVLRDGVALANVDLYRFLLDGHVPGIQFKDGDTIVVGARGSSVQASGDINNAAAFELLDEQLSGKELIAMAHLLPGVSFAGVSGIRANRPYSVYLPIDEFKKTQLKNGDVVSFRTDQHDQVIVVDVEGSHLGPSQFVVPVNTHLHDLLDYIEVDSELTDVSAVSIKRQTIAMRQKEALNESLQRLEARYLTASSQTDTESAIRAQEAELISQFVKNAREIEPSGRLVVSQGGEIANILLKSGDTITIPSRSDSVLLSGEVVVAQAILFKPGRKAREYIRRSGGFSQQAKTDRIVLVHANGEVTSEKNPMVSAGDEIIVLPKVPVKNLQIASTIVDILYKIAVAASVAVRL